MTENTSRSQTAHRRYTRPVFFVADVNRAARFYVETWWGYDTLQVDDPDGNELLFPRPD